MRFFNKYFFIGLGAGAVLTIALIFLGAKIYFMRTMPSPEEPPEFPSHPKISVYEQTEHWSIRTLEGTEMRLSQFKGKVVFLNFWATWCRPCRAEMPTIQNLYNYLNDEDVIFLLISNESKVAVQSFLEKKQFTFPVYLYTDDLPNVLKSPGIPATFILDRDGRIVFKHVGSAKWDEESCWSFLRGLM